MRNSAVFRAQPTFDDIEPELSVYLAQRFASKGFADKIIHETRKRLADDEALSLVEDARVYVCGLAMGVGKQLLEDEYLKTHH